MTDVKQLIENVLEEKPYDFKLALKEMMDEKVAQTLPFFEEQAEESLAGELFEEDDDFEDDDDDPSDYYDNDDEGDEEIDEDDYDLEDFEDDEDE